MATADQVRELRRRHPDWHPSDIAEKLDCDPAYVRATFMRHGWAMGGRRLQPAYRVPLHMIEGVRLPGEIPRETIDRVFTAAKPSTTTQPQKGTSP